MNKLAINLVVWNGSKYISYLFDSLKKQSFKDFKLYILDNNSSDNTLELIEKELKTVDFEYEFYKNKENLGFAGGHNYLYEKITEKYFLLLNQDMYLKEDSLEKLIKFLDENEDVAVVSPRLMKWDFANIKNGLEKSFSNKIDSLGLKLCRNRQVSEIFTEYDWEEIKNNFKNNKIEVFGVSGAFPVFRKKMIDKIRFSEKEFLDSDYHSYKEDVDLAYRLSSAGEKAFVILDAVTYHDRTASGLKELNRKNILNNKHGQSDYVKYHSYKNHLLTIYKNEYLQNFILDFFFILWYELKKFAYYLLYDRKVLKAWKEVFKLKKEIKNKRKIIKNNKKLKSREFRKFIKIKY
jgi:GT2 family glycosyltransferase